MLAEDQIARMSQEERISAIERLWTSLGSDGIQLFSPEWQRPIVAERLEIADSPDAKWLSVDELQAALMKR